MFTQYGQNVIVILMSKQTERHFTTIQKDTNIKDYSIIIDAIKVATGEELYDVFTQNSFLKNIVPAAFDAHHLYFFTKEILSFKQVYSDQGINVYQIKHKNSTEEQYTRKWASAPFPFETKEFTRSLGLGFEIPFGPFFSLHKLAQEQKSNSIYTTEESMKATIIHEYAHIYFNQLILKENRQDLQDINKSLNGKLIFPKEPVFSKIHFLTNLSELYARCVELYVSKNLWKKHFQNMVKQEREFKGSILSKKSYQYTDPHLFSIIYASSFMSSYPRDWMVNIFNELTLR